MIVVPALSGEDDPEHGVVGGAISGRVALPAVAVADVVDGGRAVDGEQAPGQAVRGRKHRQAADQPDETRGGAILMVEAADAHRPSSELPASPLRFGTEPTKRGGSHSRGADAPNREVHGREGTLDVPIDQREEQRPRGRDDPQYQANDTEPAVQGGQPEDNMRRPLAKKMTMPSTHRKP